jgi:hypothetical protein
VYRTAVPEPDETDAEDVADELGGADHPDETAPVGVDDVPGASAAGEVAVDASARSGAAALTAEPSDAPAPELSAPADGRCSIASSGGTRRSEKQ